MRYNTIILDFDGTLADTFPVVFGEVKKIAKEEKVSELLSDRITDFRNMGADQLLKEFKVPFYKLPFILRRVRSVVHTQSKELVLFDGVQKVLESLHKKGVMLGIASSNQEDTIQTVLEKYHLDLFSFIHTEFNIFGKAQMLKGILKKYSLVPEKTLYVGDEVRDIEACQKISLDCAAVTWGFNLKHILSKYNPTFLIEEPENLISLI